MKTHCDSCQCKFEPRHYHVAIDFDGPIHAYSKGLYDGTIYDGLTPGFLDALQAFRNLEHRIVVFTCREKESVIEWLKGHNIDLPVTNAKPIANVYIDDRGFHWKNWGITAMIDVLQLEAAGERGFNEK